MWAVQRWIALQMGLPIEKYLSDWSTAVMTPLVVIRYRFLGMWIQPVAQTAESRVGLQVQLELED